MSLRNWDCTEQDRSAGLLFICMQKCCHIAENEKLAGAGISSPPLVQLNAVLCRNLHPLPPTIAVYICKTKQSAA